MHNANLYNTPEFDSWKYEDKTMDMNVHHSGLLVVWVLTTGVVGGINDCLNFRKILF